MKELLYDEKRFNALNYCIILYYLSLKILLSLVEYNDNVLYYIYLFIFLLRLRFHVTFSLRN